MYDDDSLRHLMPLLRRIVILVAVLTAVPVILWTITALVHGYVGPPQLPTSRPAAATASTAALERPAAGEDRSDRLATAVLPPAAAPASALSTSPSPVAQPKARSADAGGLPPALSGRPMNDAAGAEAKAPPETPAIVDEAKASPSMPPVAEAALTAPVNADATATAGSAPATAQGSTQTTAALSPPAALEPTAEPASGPAVEALPAVAPLAGSIPLPPRRPRHFAMAQLSAEPRGGLTKIPMPRPRPDAAGPPTTPGPFDWLQHIFQPH